MIDRAQIYPQHVDRFRDERRRVVVPVKEPAQLLEGRPHRRDRLVLQFLDRLIVFARRVGIHRRRIGERISQPDQVHDQLTRLLAVDAAHPVRSPASGCGQTEDELLQ